MNIYSKITFDLVKIYFNDILHLCFLRREVLGFQTWKAVCFYTIEITFRNGSTIVVEYDEFDKWTKIICLIEDALTN